MVEIASVLVARTSADQFKSLLRVHVASALVQVALRLTRFDGHRTRPTFGAEVFNEQATTQHEQQANEGSEA